MLLDKIERLIWDAGPSLYGSVAAPFGALYGRVTEFRAGLYERKKLGSYRPRCLAVSVGNLTLGGSGKTPITMALAESFVARDVKPVIVTRGYKGCSKADAVLVGPDSDPMDVGDEPVMMAKRLPGVPVIRSPRRRDGARVAEAQFNPGAIIMDDAFGHLDIERDFDIIVVDAPRGFGNGRPLPVGPLREPLSALGRADAVIITHADEVGQGALDTLEFIVREHNSGAGIYKSSYKIVGLVDETGGIPEPAGAIRDQNVITFSGIGSPLSFNGSVTGRLGAKVAESFNFRDHYNYSDADLERISAACAGHGVGLAVTTEKDLARLKGRRPRGVDVVAPQITVEVEDFQCLTDRILGKR